MAKMKESFPADVDYAVTLDTTDAVRAGMHEIVQTLLEAFVLVILVVYIFLQDWRATSFQCSRCLSRWWPRSLYFRCSAFRSIPFRCSGWSWRSAWWWTMPSSWSKAYNTTSKRV